MKSPGQVNYEVNYEAHYSEDALVSREYPWSELPADRKLLWEKAAHVLIEGARSRQLIALTEQFSKLSEGMAKAADPGVSEDMWARYRMNVASSLFINMCAEDVSDGGSLVTMEAKAVKAVNDAKDSVDFVDYLIAALRRGEK